MLQKRQVVYRKQKNNIIPFRLAKSKQNLDIIEQMIEGMEGSVGEKRSDIEKNLQYFARQTWQPKVSQAIIKLLLDKGKFEEDKKGEFIEIRQKVFQNSQKFWFNLQEPPLITKIVPTIFKASFKDLPNFQSECFLYKDLPTNQQLEDFKTISPEDFIDWVDICMLRGLLLHAESMEVIFYSNQQFLRTFMRYLKFFGLLFFVEKKKNSWSLLIDGPESVLDSSRIYGINFSNLLPAALSLKGEWKINVKILIDKNYYKLVVHSDDNYQSSYQKNEFLRQQKITDFVKYWDQGKSNASFCNDILMLKENIYLLPDIKVNKNEKEYYLEWIQYPLGNKELLEKKACLCPHNYFFLVISTKKKINNFSEKTQKKIIFFSKNFIQSKIEEKINANENQSSDLAGSSLHC